MRSSSLADGHKSIDNVYGAAVPNIWIPGSVLHRLGYVDNDAVLLSAGRFTCDRGLRDNTVPYNSKIFPGTTLGRQAEKELGS